MALVTNRRDALGGTQVSTLHTTTQPAIRPEAQPPAMRSGDHTTPRASTAPYFIPSHYSSRIHPYIQILIRELLFYFVKV